jgi:hypothetical protein
MKPIDAFAATFGELLPNLASIAPSDFIRL